MKCPECRNDIPDGSLKCMYCGYPISEQTQFVNNSDDYFYQSDYRRSTDYTFNDRRNFESGQINRPMNGFYDYGAYGANAYSNYKNPNVSRRVQNGRENNEEIIKYLLIAVLGVNLIDMFLLAAILLVL